MKYSKINQKGKEKERRKEREREMMRGGEGRGEEGRGEEGRSIEGKKEGREEGSPATMEVH
jgi:hypothetical protein